MFDGNWIQTKAPIVREMSRLAIEENLGYKSIADKLAARGLRSRDGPPFAAYTVQKVSKQESGRSPAP